MTAPLSNIIASAVTDTGVTVSLDRAGDTITVLLDRPGMPIGRRQTVEGRLTRDQTGFIPVSYGPALDAGTLRAIANLMEHL